MTSYQVHRFDGLAYCINSEICHGWQKLSEAKKKSQKCDINIIYFLNNYFITNFIYFSLISTLNFSSNFNNQLFLEEFETI